MTLETVAALSNGSPEACYVALFEGKCGFNGGVYKISPQDDQLQQQCGKLVEDWEPATSPAGQSNEVTLYGADI